MTRLVIDRDGSVAIVAFGVRGMWKSIAILFAGLCFVGFLAGPAAIQPGDSGGLAIVGMCMLPTFAYFAGIFWYQRVVFLAYGGVGMLPFVLHFLSDRGLGRKVESGISVWFTWTVVVVIVMLACRFTGSLERELAQKPE